MKEVFNRFAWMLAGVLVSLGHVASAGDLFPPCWRGASGSTYQLWNFTSNANPASPDVMTNAFGSPTATSVVMVGGSGWNNTLFVFGTNQGIWDLGTAGSLTLNLPTQPASTGWRYVSVQVQQLRSAGYTNLAVVNLSGATLVSSQLMTNNFTGGGLSSPWVVAQSVWRLDPDPGPGSVVITAAGGGAAIDQVIVDTVVFQGDDGDYFVPCWRGGPASSFQSWSFHTPAAVSVPPEQASNPFSPTATVTPGAGGLGWYDSESGVGCRQGFWDLGSFGTIDCTVPATAGSPASYKYVQVQVVRFADSFIYTAPPTVSVSAGVSTVTPMSGPVSQPWENGVFGQWFIDQTVWRVEPDAGPVTVTVTAPGSGSLVDQVTVDTLTLDPPCPTDQIVNADPGICGKAGVAWSLPVPDGCIITNIISVPTNGSAFDVGATVVTNRFQDSLGGEKLCTFTVTVLDAELPVVQCPADILVTNNPALCGAVVSFVATAMDNCSVTNISCLPASGSLFPLGVTTVTCVATDASGNNSLPCEFTVRVIDISGDLLVPCWRGQDVASFQQWAFSTNDLNPVPELTDNPSNATAVVTLGGDGLGWYDQESGAGCRQGYWDLGNGGTIQLSVPSTNGPVDSYEYVRVQMVYLFDGLIYPNAPTVSVTAGVATVTQVGAVEDQLLSTIPTGAWRVQKTLWKVAPGGGTATVQILAPPQSALVDQVIVDTLLVQPEPCLANILADADAGQCGKTNVTWSPLPVVDGCLTLFASEVPASGSNFPVGTTPVTRTIVDAENQTNICMFDVVITDTQPPLALCQDIILPLDAMGNATLLAGMVDAGSSDNCGLASLSVSHTNFTCADIGPNNVTLTVTDVHGLISNCVAVVTVADQTAPVIAALAAVEDQFSWGPTNVLDCAHTVVQGVVEISVSAYDTCFTISPPAIVLTNGGVGEAAVFTTEAPAGVFNYQWPVTAGTSNGTWTATVSATDGVNVATTNFLLCVYTAEVAITMLPLTISNDVPVVQFMATPGQSYSLQRSTDLSVGAWTTLTNIYLPLPPGGDGIGEYLDADGVVSNAFYRARFP